MTLCKRAPANIQSLCASYQRRHGVALQRAVKNVSGSEYRRFLFAVLAPWDEYWAKRINDALHGLGGDAAPLTRAFVMNDKATFPSVAAAYERLFQKSLLSELPPANQYNNALRMLLE